MCRTFSIRYKLIADHTSDARHASLFRKTRTMPHDIDVMVGKRVRLRRLQLPISQTEFAQKLGLTIQQVQKYENGANRISCSRIYEIADVLDVPINFFFSDK